MFNGGACNTFPGRVDGCVVRAYTAAMKSRSVYCRTVALIAAYAVALQVLLSAFVPVEPSLLASPVAALCSYDEAGGASHPARHDLPCAAMCAALGHGNAGPIPPDVVIAYAGPVVVAPLAPVNDWVVPGVALDGPQAPRGPPLA